LRTIYETLEKHKAKEQEKYKEYYDRSHKKVEFAPGDLVMVRFAAGKEGLSYKLLEH
jgi:hypothetical protein